MESDHVTREPRTLWVHASPGMDGPETYYEPMNHCWMRRHGGCTKCIEFREVLKEADGRSET